MKKSLFLMIFCLLPMFVSADNRQLLSKLDSIIRLRPHYTEEKERRIERIKEKAASEKQEQVLLRLYRELSEEYYVYQFDSAMVYTNKGLSLAQKTGSQQYLYANTIAKAELLAVGGLYSEAIQKLDSLPEQQLDHELQLRYHIAYFTLYGYWADYCNDTEYSPQYKKQAYQHLAQVTHLLQGTEELYDYYMGEYHVYVTHHQDKALEYYLKAFHAAREDSRTYARAAFAIANNYSAAGNMEKYEEYLIKSGICDMVSTTKEHLALQYLASYLSGQDTENLERAEHYINVSMEDAKFYNNRLRMLEASKVMPFIVSAYQNTIKQQNSSLKYAIVGISFLVFGLFVSLFFIARQNRQLTSQRKELSQNNALLTDLNARQKDLNARLKEANESLIDTNHKREGLARIYIHLCAKYIEKLKKYQTLVKRKIKANQVNELLSTMSSSRISEEDAATFMNNFDKAFLDLYPTFITEFNTLLMPQEQIRIKQANTLTTELRIYALIRLGVRESSEIADLLFYSPQTIYNYRSITKNKAVSKETFDDDVQQLCTVIKS